MGANSFGRGVRWQSLLQRVEEAVFVLDRRRRLLFVNRSFEQLADLTADRVRGLVCRRPQSVKPDDSAEEVLAHLLTPPPEANQGRICQVRRLFLSRHRTSPAVRQWWDIEFFPLRQSGPQDGYLILGRILPLPIDLPPGQLILPEKLENLRIRQQKRYTFEWLRSNTLAMRRLQAQARLASQVVEPVLLRGERGTGKHTLARIIHAQGCQQEKYFVGLNCRKLPSRYLTEFFLTDRGSTFWQSIGTLYLAEPAALPRELQQHLCTWLATGNGPRLIVGTSEPIDRLLDELQWRIATISIDLPPLRQRIEDLPLLLEHAQLSKPLTASALEAFRAYAWPGNLTELWRVLREAAGASTSEQIELADLPMPFREARLLELEPVYQAESLSLEQLLNRVEERLIRLALKRTRGNRTRAAELLGIHRPRLLRRLEALGITHSEEEA